MINAKLQNIIDTKSAIGNAIVNKGGTITSETPFLNYASEIDNISTGTPQTIFAASDGSKWALTNVVNLVNSAGNVTHDFNYWQPANNGTSDPILNIGTVNGNISGNIRIVQVNQVNIAQYGNIVATDTLGGKYVGYNGYDSQTNPTPTGNTTFNRWLLNNSATGTILFANATIVNGGIYNGPNTIINQSIMNFVSNSPNFGGTIETIAVNNGFVYVGGAGTNGVRKYYESNLTLLANTAPYGGTINIVRINNGFLYVGGATNQTIHKYHESNLAFVGNSPAYGTIYGIGINNGFIFAGGGNSFGPRVSKYDESTLAFVANSPNATSGGEFYSVAINNGFVYAAGSINSSTIQKFHESNLVFSANSANYGATIYSIGINNGFIYAGGGFALSQIQKYDESTLSFNSNSANYGSGSAAIRELNINSGFIFVGGSNPNTVQKFHESNLTFIANTASYGAQIRTVTTNGGFIYAGGFTDQTVQKFEKFGGTFENIVFYNITTIKE